MSHASTTAATAPFSEQPFTPLPASRWQGESGLVVGPFSSEKWAHYFAEVVLEKIRLVRPRATSSAEWTPGSSISVTTRIKTFISPSQGIYLFYSVGKGDTHGRPALPHH
jgi:hypothetical protein